MVRDVESKINDEVQPDRGKLLIIFESCDRIINRVVSSWQGKLFFSNNLNNKNFLLYNVVGQ